MRRLAIIGLLIALAVLLGEAGGQAQPTYQPILPNCSGTFQGNGALPTSCSGIAIVPNLAALRAIPAGGATVAYRSGFNSPDDGGGGEYTYTPFSCETLGAVNDGGYCADSIAQTGSWIIVIPTQGLNAAVFGQNICGGQTDDTVALQTALFNASKVILPLHGNCIVSNLVMDGSEIDCNGAVLIPAPGASYALKVTGYNTNVRNCQFNDPDLNTQVATTLSQAANPGATTIHVAATTFQIGQVIAITMNSGMNFVTRVSGVAGNVVTLADPIPSSATGASVAAGGSGFGTGDALIVQGGVGLPTVLTATASAGVLTGVSISAPGKYTTVPSFPAQIVDAHSPGASAGTINLTMSGANINNVVRAAYGVLWADSSVLGTFDNIKISEAPVGIEISNLAATGGSGPIIRNFSVNAATIAGVFKDVNVSQAHVSDGDIFCFAPNAPHFGPVGIYENGQALTVATGGNFWFGVNVGQCEIGVQTSAAQLDFFNNVISDSNRNAAWDLESSGNMVLTGNTWAAATGFNTSSFGTGIGLHIGHNSALVTVNGLETSANASDIDIDSTSNLILSNWGPTKVFTGYGPSIINAAPKTYDFYTVTPVGSTGVTVYLGPGGAIASAPNTSYNVATAGPVTNMLCSVGVAPGAGQSYTCTLVVSNAGPTPVTCTISNTNNNCTYTGPVNGGEAYLEPNEQIYIQVVPSSGTFSANYFNGFVAQQ